MRQVSPKALRTLTIATTVLTLVVLTAGLALLPGEWQLLWILGMIVGFAVLAALTASACQ
jgi:hypothetical protein